MKSSTLRYLTIALGIAGLLWLTVEDVNLALTLILAALICALSADYVWLKAARAANRRWSSLPLLGLIFGLAISPTALILMALKTGLHAHRIPDFSGAQILAVLQLTPAFAIAGLLLGFGCNLMMKFLNLSK